MYIYRSSWSFSRPPLYSGSVRYQRPILSCSVLSRPVPSCPVLLNHIKSNRIEPGYHLFIMCWEKNRAKSCRNDKQEKQSPRHSRVKQGEGGQQVSQAKASQAKPNQVKPNQADSTTDKISKSPHNILQRREKMEEEKRKTTT